MTFTHRRQRWLSVLIAAAGVACGTHVTVGLVDGLPTEADDTEAGVRGARSTPPPPRSFADGGLRREASAPTPSCEELQCGDLCIPCAADASDCPPPAVFHVCTAEGTCAPTNPFCLVVREDAGGADWSACVGLRCGDRCSPCDPTSASCPDAGNAYTCRSDATCRLGAAICQ